MKWYEVPAQIMECTMDEECKDIEAMEFRPRENGNHNFTRGKRGQKTNLREQGRGNFGCGSRTEYTTQRQNFTNNNSHGTGRGLNHNFRPIFQDNPKSAKWDPMFQAQGLDGRAMLETLKKLSAYALIKTNMTDTPYSRKVMQHNPHIRERIEDKTRSAEMMDNNPSVKRLPRYFVQSQDKKLQRKSST